MTEEQELETYITLKELFPASNMDSWESWLIRAEANGLITAKECSQMLKSSSSALDQHLNEIFT